ncbi:6-carboxytetrahydropterin synthase [Flavobacterium pectinovorum]|uniref:6-pyruvoyl trahydropterin synthase family protein n=1 Tax=Flavobacterium pectinovorum TaxID=29533 RepID=UPI00265EF1E1|nr:6-carboxytetrahydropterin synthase [Flavobacterium pectinovorum]WKL47845.1 6-carboxytetrahydropterin synthase [Flavobacterium pectinovorum]WKL48953.1 6-carboxytetrahydropterin synthase [Flavobacterium pectinovorum]
MKTTICREAHFNACHRMHNPNWSDQKNKEIFGICNNANYHGHNFRLIVKITGEINPETGYVMDMKVLGTIIKNEIEDRFDHKNLNLDCLEFADTIASTENFAWVIFGILKSKLSKDIKLKIILFETDKNSVEVEE